MSEHADMLCELAALRVDLANARAEVADLETLLEARGYSHERTSSDFDNLVKGIQEALGGVDATDTSTHRVAVARIAELIKPHTF